MQADMDCLIERDAAPAHNFVPGVRVIPLAIFNISLLLGIIIESAQFKI